jgi:ABC-type molybdenum transport system ATPase subunit/photorepair protein PhrA
MLLLDEPSCELSAMSMNLLLNLISELKIVTSSQLLLLCKEVKTDQ